MGTIISNGTGGGLASAGASWIGGVAPADDDAITIAPGDTITWNIDAALWTGSRTVTISGHASSPGMLRFMAGTSGHLKVRTGYHIVGTTGAQKGRLLANADGVWGNTGDLPYADKAVIDLQGTAQIQALYLDIALRCTDPTIKYARTYAAVYTCPDQTTGINLATNTITFSGALPANLTPVRFLSTGTLPPDLSEDCIYYLRYVSGTTCKVSLYGAASSDQQIIDFTGTGTGELRMYTGHTDTATKIINVVDDVTGDPQWTTTAGHNLIVLGNVAPDSYDQQQDTLAGVAAASLTLTTANVDSVQYPFALILLMSRNVSIRSSGTTGGQALIDYGAGTHGGVFKCEFVNTASSGTNYYGSAVNGGVGHTILGGTAHKLGRVVNGGSYATISNGVFGALQYGTITSYQTISGGLWCGINIVLYSGTGGTISGGVFAGCSYVVNAGVLTRVTGGKAIGGNEFINACAAPSISGVTILSGNRGVNGCFGAMLTDATIRGMQRQALFQCFGDLIRLTITHCYRAMQQVHVRLVDMTVGPGNGVDIFFYGTEIRGNNVTLASTVQTYANLANVMPGVDYPNYAMFTDYAGVSGDIGAWTPGGYAKSEVWSAPTHDPSGQLTPAPARVHAMRFQDNGGDHWITIPFRGVAGRAARVRVSGRLSGVAAWTDRPTLAIVDPSVGWRQTGEILSSQLMPSDTDWHTYTLSYVPTVDGDLAFLVRGKGGTAAGTGSEYLYFTFDIAPAASPRAMACAA